jgi:hypothetical protein
MANPHEKLAESLEVLRALEERGIVAVRSGDLTRTHRERLVKNGFLQEVMKGWYIHAHPDEVTGESTAWYASFWGFCAAYLKERFGTNWSLSPEQSLLLHAGNMKIPRHETVRDCMQAFFNLLREEPEPSVRVVLGHFVFVYVHPYMDGNGRMGRFLMNVMLASGGYPWTVIPLDKRDDYMTALEGGSVEQDITPFTIFLGGLVSESLERKQIKKAT